MLPALDPTGPLALFVLCAFSGVALPVPEEIPLLYAGMRIGSGGLSPASALFAGFLGVLTRDVALLAIGRGVGAWAIEHPWAVRLIGRRRLDRALALVAEREVTAILFARFVPGMRVPVFAAAGAMGMSFRRFLAWDIAGICVLVPAMLIAGARVGPPVVSAMQWAMGGTHALAAACVFVACAWLLRARRRRRLAINAAGVAVEVDVTEEEDDEASLSEA
jgi:membrane protein DedA with SNARE-associated domain